MNSQQLQLARLQSHERHMRHIYGLRWGGLALAALTICIGAAMIFAGLQGSFDWAFQAPNSLSAKLTNASPGIIFATVGMMIGIITVAQKPVSYDTGYDGIDPGAGISITDFIHKKEENKARKRGVTLGVTRENN